MIKIEGKKVVCNSKNVNWNQCNVSKCNIIPHTERLWRIRATLMTTTRDDDDYGQSKKIVIKIMLIICFHCNEFLLFYLLNQRDGKWVEMAHSEMEWGEKWGFVCQVIILIKKQNDFLQTPETAPICLIVQCQPLF